MSKPQGPEPQPSAWQMMEHVRYVQQQEQARTVSRLDWVAFLLVLVGLAGPVVPYVGLVMWVVGWPVCLALLIVSIVMMTKGAPVRGVLGLFFALIMLPLWILVAPLIVVGAVQKYERIQAYREKKEQAGEGASGMRSAPASSAPGVPAPVSDARERIPTVPLPAKSATEVAAPSGMSDGLETVTAPDGRKVRGTVLKNEPWGIRLRREDGQEVNITFGQMSSEDAFRFRKLQDRR